VGWFGSVVGEFTLQFLSYHTKPNRANVLMWTSSEKYIATRVQPLISYNSPVSGCEEGSEDADGWLEASLEAFWKAAATADTICGMLLLVRGANESLNPEFSPRGRGTTSFLVLFP